MLLKFLPWIGLALLCLPALDILGIVMLWHYLGSWTLLWLTITTVLGVVILKSWRLTAAWALLDSLRSGQVPLGRLFWFGRSLVAAGLFIFPGPISDFIALLLIVPWPGHSKNWADNKEQVQEHVIEAEFEHVRPRAQAELPHRGNDR